MGNKRKIIIIVGIILSILLAVAGTYAVWIWTSNVDKGLVMNTMSGLDNNIIYDDGDSKFIGDFAPTNKFCESEYNTISFYKTGELENRDVNATIYMEVAAIGDNIAASSDVYWVLTEGDNTINCDDMLNSSSILAYGNFNGFEAGESIELLSDIYVTTEVQKFTVWIWIDNSSSNLSSLSGETIHANVWTEFEVLGKTKYVVSLDVNGGQMDTSVVLKEYNEYGSYTYSMPFDSEYQVEVWGAAGGSRGSQYIGYGGYAQGKVTLSANQKLYINVGGQGQEVLGGYNGGGSGGSGNSQVGAGGGGATHIATVIGQLSTLSNKVDNLLIVAGGGGGTGTGGHGGSGGGINGGVGYDTFNNSSALFNGTGATQTTGGKTANNDSCSAGTFGVGASFCDETYGGSGGGGGYYGGGGSNCGHGGGGGGSGYIGSSLLTDKFMYCYNCDTSTDADTLTYSTTSYSSSAVSNQAKSGNGAARITMNNAVLVRAGDKYGNLPIPTKEGYTFLGWYTAETDGTLVTSDTVMNQLNNHTLYAHWQAN